MSTSTSTAINTAAVDGLWIAVSELARQKGVDKAAISRRVTRLEAQGALQTRSGAGGTKLVNIAAYDRAVGQTADAIRTMNGTGSPPPPPPAPAPRSPDDAGADPVLAREQARNASYQAELRRLDLEERTGKLLPVEAVAAASRACAEKIIRAVEQQPSRADEIAAAVGKDGVAGARAIEKARVRELRTLIERELRALVENGAAAPVDDDEETDAP